MKPWKMNKRRQSENKADAIDYTGSEVPQEGGCTVPDMASICPKCPHTPCLPKAGTTRIHSEDKRNAHIILSTQWDLKSPGNEWSQECWLWLTILLSQSSPRGWTREPQKTENRIQDILWKSVPHFLSFFPSEIPPLRPNERHFRNTEPISKK